MRTLTPQDLEDMLLGAVILGAGGGGDIAEGRAMIETALAAGKTFDLVALDEVPDDAIICTPYLLGALTPLSPEEERLYAGLAESDTDPLLQAYTEFQEHLGQTFYGTTPCELGGSNTAAAFFPAAMNGHKIMRRWTPEKTRPAKSPTSAAAWFCLKGRPRPSPIKRTAASPSAKSNW